jgi:hypothetical protein
MKERRIKLFGSKKTKQLKINKEGEPEMENLEQATVKMAPPWIQFVSELNALFGQDPAIEVVYDDDNKQVKLLVDGQAKADALTQLLPTEKEFGNVTLNIAVIPANKLKSTPDLYKAAFEGNPAYVGTFVAEGIFNNPIGYVIFKKEVVQFFNDNLADAHGNMNTLYQNVADDVFTDHQGIFFCTDTGSDLVGKPLGEWP